MPGTCAVAIGQRSTSGSSRDSPCRPAGRSDVTSVEVSEFHAVGEQNSTALPIEAVGEDDLARGRGRNVGQVHDGHHAVAHAEVELIGVGFGERVGFPSGHVPIMPHHGFPVRHHR